MDGLRFYPDSDPSSRLRCSSVRPGFVDSISTQRLASMQYGIAALPEMINDNNIAWLTTWPKWRFYSEFLKNGVYDFISPGW